MSPTAHPNPDTNTTAHPDIQTLHKSLTTQATTLLSELTAFHTYLTTQLTSTTVANPLITRPDTLLGKFQVDVQREVDHLLRYAVPETIPGSQPQTQVQRDTTHQEGRTTAHSATLNSSNHDDTPTSLDGIHRIRSSNITFLSDVWEGLKRARGVIGVRKTIRYLPATQRSHALTASSQDEEGGVLDSRDRDAQQDGIKGVSKKMNREARERDKRDREVQSQSPPHHQDQNQMNGSRHTEGVQSFDGPKTWKTRGKPITSSQGVTPRRGKETVTVDIVADHGATWIKMFTKNLRWLVMDLAKEGVVDVGGSDEEEEGGDDGGSQGGCDEAGRGTGVSGLMCGDLDKDQDDEGMEELKLVKMAREFLDGSRTVRVGRGHRHPRVQFHLPKIGRGVSRDVDRVFRYMGRMGVEVITAEELEKGEQNGVYSNGNGAVGNNECTLQKAFERMACPLAPVPVTDTLNVDCTILIALISDVSHFRQSSITIPEHYKGCARRDIETQLLTDVEDPLLPKHIYPILRGRRLICTRKAIEHWRNIVRAMGSPTETERCKILLGEMDDIDNDSNGLTARQRLQQLSVHEMPEDLQIPFEIVDFDIDGMSASGDGNYKEAEIAVMKKLAEEPRLSSLNCSVFFHGWYRDLSTVSLNRVISEWLTRAVDAVLDNMESTKGVTSDIAEATRFRGANILICGRERSLLGSEK